MALKKAVDIVTTAVEEDRKKKYERALELYEESIEYFHRELKFVSHSKKSKNSIRDKCKQYIDRAEKLRHHLNKERYAKLMEDSDDGAYGGSDDFRICESCAESKVDEEQAQSKNLLMEIESKLRDKEQENDLLKTEIDNLKKVNDKLNRYVKILKDFSQINPEIENIQNELESSFNLTLSCQIDALKTKHRKERNCLVEQLEKDFDKKIKEKDKQIKQLEQKVQAEEQKRILFEDKVHSKRKKCKELKERVEEIAEDKSEMKKEFEKEIQDKDRLIDKLRESR